MTSSPFEPPLTEAAAAALDEYLDDIREEVLRRARDNASESTSGYAPEVTVRDVIAAAERTSSGVSGTTRRGIRERMLSVYGLVFAAAAIVGVLLWLGPELGSRSPQESVGLLTAVTGAFGYLASRAALEAARRLDARGLRGPSEAESRHGLTGRFLSQYNDLELTVRGFNARTLGETAAGRNPTSTVLHSGVLDKRTAEELRGVVEVRNRLVHGKAVSNEEIQDALTDMQRLQGRIENR
ncbi:hypothetical protein ACWG8W_07570 [Citricoccus zhacaiensis]